MSKSLLFLSLATLLTAGFAGCLSDTEEPAETTGGFVEWTYEPTEEPVPAVEEPAPAPGLRFIALGDQGTGGEGQYAVAAAMETVCAERGCDFAVALGDNIYESGVKDEYDGQFDSKFELPYANFSIPFYMTLGNHDNSMDPATDDTVVILGELDAQPLGTMASYHSRRRS